MGNIKFIFSSNKYNFSVKKWKKYDFLKFFLELLLKLSDFLNSDDSMGKITPKFIRVYPVFVKKRFKVSKNRFF